MTCVALPSPFSGQLFFSIQFIGLSAAATCLQFQNRMQGNGGFRGERAMNQAHLILTGYVGKMDKRVSLVTSTTFASIFLAPCSWTLTVFYRNEKKKCTICEYEWPLDPEIYIQASLKAHVVIPSHTIYVNFFYFVEKGSPVVTPIIMYESKIISWPKKKIRFPPE